MIYHCISNKNTSIDIQETDKKRDRGTVKYNAECDADYQKKLQNYIKDSYIKNVIFSFKICCEKLTQS